MPLPPDAAGCAVALPAPVLAFVPSAAGAVAVNAGGEVVSALALAVVLPTASGEDGDVALAPGAVLGAVPLPTDWLAAAVAFLVALLAGPDSSRVLLLGALALLLVPAVAAAGLGLLLADTSVTAGLGVGGTRVVV